MFPLHNPFTYIHHLPDGYRRRVSLPGFAIGFILMDFHLRNFLPSTIVILL
jgi:hypothetical protein